MTPSEKATELIGKFSPLVTTWNCYWDTERNPDDILADAKKCALIAVDEIISITPKELPSVKFDTIIHVPNFELLFWKSVRQQIENETYSNESE